MLSVLPNIPVVIQPKFPEIVLGSRLGRNSTQMERVPVGFYECRNSVVDSDSSGSFDCISSDWASSYFNLSRRLNVEQIKDSPGFLEFICNSSSQIDSNGTAAPYMSGGLQRYLIESQQRRGSGDAIENNMLNILNLPDSIQLHIFSFLDAKTLCTVASVCQRWSSLSCDDLLWCQRLEWDEDKWSVIGDNTNPDGCEDCTYKETYLRCSPEVAEFSRRSNFLVHRLSGLLRSLMPKKDPRVAMFGPGLESRTSGLVRNILQNRSEMFTTVQMFPGQFGGVGSGFKVKVNSVVTVDLITIYNATQMEREQWSAEERLQKSRMLTSDGSSSSDDRGEQAQSDPTYDLQQNIQDLCKTLDGLIFVVDATLPLKELTLARPELFAMTNERWTRSGAPVLVLSCTPNTDTGYPISCRRVVQQLQLQRLNRPWQVRSCCVETMDGFAAASQWIAETCHRK